MKFLAHLTLSLFLLCVHARATEGDLPLSVGEALKAANDAQLTAALSASQPGQHIVLTGSSYSTTRTLGKGKVLVGNPASPPKITGTYTLTGPDAIVYGLEFAGGRIRVQAPGDNCQIIRNYFHSQTQDIVDVDDGDDVVIAFNEFFEWGATGECNACKAITVRAPFKNGSDGARRIRISYNYFHDQLGYNPETCPNDAEVIAFGETQSSGRSESAFEGWMHHNYVVNCFGDNEGIVIKSSYNTIEYNHLDGVRGFNGRFGGFNQYIANRVENLLGGGSNFNRGGYNNLSLGEVMPCIQVWGGNYSWGDTPVSYLRSDGTQIVGAVVGSLAVGVDTFSNWSLHAIDTMIWNTNALPILGPKQTRTTVNKDGPAPFLVPAAITLTADDVGPLASASTVASVAIEPAEDASFGYVVKGETADLHFTLTNTTPAPASGSVHVSAPFTIASGATFDNLQQGESATFAVRYAPEEAGRHTGLITVQLDNGVGPELPVDGIALEVLDSLRFDATDGTVVAPFASQGSYVAQPMNASFGAGGMAAYAINIATAGTYKVAAEVNAPTNDENSFWISFDQEPKAEDIWDVIDLTNGFQLRDVSSRGNGAFDNPQHVPATWNLSAGIHVLVLRGREKNVQLRSLEVVRLADSSPGNNPAAPHAPSNMVVAGQE